MEFLDKALLDDDLQLFKKITKGKHPTFFRKNEIIKKAAKWGSVGILKFLKEEIGLSKRDAQGDFCGSPLVEAVKNYQLGAVKYLHKGFGLTIEDARYRNNLAFRYAVDKNCLPIIQYLKEGFGITPKDVKSHSDWDASAKPALYVSAEKGMFSVFKYIVEEFEMKFVDIVQTNALDACCINGNLKILKYTVNRYKQFLNMAYFRRNDNCAIRLSALRGHLDIIKYLVNNLGFTKEDVALAVKYAIEGTKNEVVRYLEDKFDFSEQEVRQNGKLIFIELAKKGDVDDMRTIEDKFQLIQDDIRENDFQVLIESARCDQLNVVAYLVRQFRLENVDLTAHIDVLEYCATHEHFRVLEYLLLHFHFDSTVMTSDEKVSLLKCCCKDGGHSFLTTVIQKLCMTEWEIGETLRMIMELQARELDDYHSVWMEEDDYEEAIEVLLLYQSVKLVHSESTSYEQFIINSWLRRLERAKDYHSMKETAQRIVATTESDESFKAIFFPLVEKNLERCGDRAAMNFNEVFTAWKLHTLGTQDEASRFKVCVAAAKTHALRIVVSQIAKGGESVETYLWVETKLKDDLGLLTFADNPLYGVGSQVDLDAIKTNVQECWRTHLLDIMDSQSEFFPDYPTALTEDEEAPFFIQLEQIAAVNSDEYVKLMGTLQAQRRDKLQEKKWAWTQARI